MRHFIAFVLIIAVLPLGSAQGGFKIKRPKITAPKKPHIVHEVQRQAQAGVDRAKGAVKGHVSIRVHNRTDGHITLTANIGNERVEVAPGKTGKITKANIGDNTVVYVNGRVLKSLGVLIKNVYELDYRG